MAEYTKPQTPLNIGEKYIYPLTTADQIILSDGTRLEKNGVLGAGGGGFVIIDENLATDQRNANVLYGLNLVDLSVPTDSGEEGE